MSEIYANQSTAAQRRVYCQLVDATDGITAELGEGGGQPYISTDGATFTTTGAGLLVHMGSGRYYFELTQVAVDTPGIKIESQYKSANTAEAIFDQVLVVPTDPEVALATADQLGQIANVGAALPVAASSFTLTTGTQTSGTYLNTKPLDGVYHRLSDVGGTLEAIYDMGIGGDGVVVSGQVTCYLNGSNDTIIMSAWDWITEAWEQVGVISGTNPDTVQVIPFLMFASYTGTGADLGKARLRFYSATLTSASLNIDQLFMTYSASNRTAGYALGAVWLDTVGGTPGSTPDYNGTADRPTSLWSDVLALLALKPLSRVHVAPGSSITLTAALANLELFGFHWNLNVGGVKLTNTIMDGAHVSGNLDPLTASTHFKDCVLLETDIVAGHYESCGVVGPLTSINTGAYIFHQCYSAIAGLTAPIFDVGLLVGDTQHNFRDWHGEADFRNIGAAGSDDISFEGNGQWILNANCVGGNFKPAGIFKETDNSAGTTVTRTLRPAVQGGLSDQGYTSARATALDNLDVAVSTRAVGIGSGSRSIVLHTQQTDTTTVGQTPLTVKNAGDDETITLGTTDPSTGNFPLPLNDGTYQIHANKNNHTAVSPQTIVVTADATFNITIDPIAISAPSAANFCVVHGTLRDVAGQAIQGGVVEAYAVTPQTVAGVQKANRVAQAVADATGYFEIELVRTTETNFVSEDADINIVRTVPDAPSQDLTTWT